MNKIISSMITGNLRTTEAIVTNETNYIDAVVKTCSNALEKCDHATFWIQAGILSMSGASEMSLMASFYIKGSKDPYCRLFGFSENTDEITIFGDPT